MALLDTPEIAEPRAEIRRRTTAISDAGNGLYNDSMTSSSSNGESDTKENESNEEQIGARDETRDDGKKKKKNTVHYAYRPSTPAHRKIKESPLSSDAIFKQRWAYLEALTRVRGGGHVLMPLIRHQINKAGSSCVIKMAWE
nr:diacylglycerol O-acyltransferase 1 [Tanacetum cinerariifolium]